MIFKKNKVKRSLSRKIGNGIIYFFLGIFILFILFFGFTQTSTFRNLVRNKILDYANEAFLAEFNLESIEGTVITSLTLNNISLVNDVDTILAVKKIEIGVNPFPLLIKELNFTRVKVKEMKLNFIKEESGDWNFSNIISPDSSAVIEKVDTLKQQAKKKGDFPFNFQVNGLEFDDVNFKMKDSKYKSNNRTYNTINFDDLVISNLNMNANIYADINSRKFNLQLDSLSFSPNLNRFNLRNFSGNIQLSEKFVEAKSISIITDSSNLNIFARLDSLNLFGEVDIENFKDYPLQLSFDANPFNGTDLSSFLDAVEFMNGPILLQLDAEGSFGNFRHKANLSLDRTNILMEGSLQNLHTPKKLFITANFQNSTVVYQEIDNFLRGLELPPYPDLVVQNMNLKYAGEPLKFKANGDGQIGEGEITFGAFMDMYPDLINYDYTFTTNNVNLITTIGINSNVNSKGKFKGKGFNPSESTSNMELFVYNSFIDKYYFDSLSANLQTTDQLIDLEITAGYDSTGASVSGLLDLAESSMPIYNLKGNFQNLDMALLLSDSAFNSSLNFEFAVDGHSLDINETEGTFDLNFIDSRIGENEFDSVKFSLDLNLEDKMRSIELRSDLLDFNLSGEFNLEDAYKLFNHQVSKISYSIGNKLADLNPINYKRSDLATLLELRRNEDIVENDLYLDYDFEFKDFRIIAALIGQDEISISGKGDGYIENDSSNFSMSTNVDIAYLFLFENRDVFYISDVTGNMNIGFDNHSYLFDNIFGSFSFDSKRIVSEINLENLSSDIVFNQSRIYYNISGDLDENIRTKLNGDVVITDSMETITIDKLAYNYYDFNIENHDPIILTNTREQFQVKQFKLSNGQSELELDGYIKEDLTQDLRLQLRNLKGGLLGKYLFGFSDNDDEMTFNIYSEIKGTAVEPILLIDFAAEDIVINKKNLGSLYCDLDYTDKNLKTKIQFTDSTRNTEKPLLTLDGEIPMYIGIEPERNVVDSSKSMNLKFVTKDFNITSLGKLIPTLSKQSGFLNSEVVLSGSLADINYDGFMNLKNARFHSEITNLKYGLDFDLIFNHDRIDVKNISLKNIDNSFNGVFSASGQVSTKGFGIRSADLMINGNLALLSNASKKSMNNLFGDLVIATENSLLYKYENGRSNLAGIIKIEEANLNFIPAESSYSVTGSDFKYVFVVDSSIYSVQREKYEKLLTALSLKYSDDSKSTTLPKNFDLDVVIRSDKVSKVSVVLSKALNQKLIADVSGSIRISNKEDQLIGQGQFDILSSSMFTFYKTFQTEGNIKFTSDITDPIINITAIYEADYVNSRVTDAEPIKTAVKIKINDKVSTLQNNIATGENPIDMKIYMGQKNIEYDIASNQYNNLDAMYFILFGTFTSDVDNADLANNAAMSVLGSTLTTMLNANFGDLINNVNFNQSGKQTRFNISGRVQKVRYTVGGSQEVFSDLSQANARLEYLFSPKFIVRAERKDPIISSSSGSNEKISEFGVKYRFAF